MKEQLEELKNKETLKINNLLKEINNTIEIIMNPELIQDNDNYFETYSFVVNKLNDIVPDLNIDNDKKRIFMIESIHEHLGLEDELLLLKYLLKNESSLNQNEKDLLNVFKRYIHVSTNSEDKPIEFYFTTNIQKKKPEAEIFNIVRISNKISITKTTQNIKNEFGIDKVERILELPGSKKLSKFVTFVSYSPKGYIELKVKDTKARRNQGAWFEQKSPKQKMPILNEIIGKEIFIPKTKTTPGANSKFTSVQWNIILELLSKYYTLTRKNDELYYLNKLHAISNLFIKN